MLTISYDGDDDNGGGADEDEDEDENNHHYLPLYTHFGPHNHKGIKR